MVQSYEKTDWLLVSTKYRHKIMTSFSLVDACRCAVANTVKTLRLL